MIYRRSLTFLYVVRWKEKMSSIKIFYRTVYFISEIVRHLQLAHVTVRRVRVAASCGQT